MLPAVGSGVVAAFLRHRLVRCTRMFQFMRTVSRSRCRSARRALERVQPAGIAAGGHDLPRRRVHDDCAVARLPPRRRGGRRRERSVHGGAHGGLFSTPLQICTWLSSYDVRCCVKANLSHIFHQQSPPIGRHQLFISLRSLTCSATVSGSSSSGRVASGGRQATGHTAPQSSRCAFLAGAYCGTCGGIRLMNNNWN